jgi:molecular chaperone GrpE
MESNQNENRENENPVNTETDNEALLEAKKQAEDAKKEVLYVKAEFENYRKRILKEQEQAIKFANKNLISELVGIIDYFDRAIQHSKVLKAKEDSEISNFVSGVEMSQHEFVQLLTRFGVEFVGKVGESFDPEKHEAVGSREVEKTQVDTVLEVFQRGSLLNGRLIKPAKVVVGKEKTN